MCTWKQATPREVLAPIKGTTDLIKQERNDLINTLAKYLDTERLLKLEKRKRRSLFCLLQEAVSDLHRKYPDPSQE